MISTNNLFFLRSRASLALLSMVLLFLIGCSSESFECRFDTDCVSGVCNADGSCAPVDNQDDTTEPDATESDDTESPDSQTDGDSDTDDSDTDDPDTVVPEDSVSDDTTEPSDNGGNTVEGDTVVPEDSGADASSDTGTPQDSDPDTDSKNCWPNKDEQIELSEFPALPGVVQNYLLAKEVTVDTSGTDWDLSAAIDGEVQASIALEALAEQWFAKSFDGATYVAPIAGEDSLQGVYEVTGNQLLLRGVVSKSEAADVKTELTYSPPAVIMNFPFKVEDTWTSTSIITGIYPLGVAYYTETHASQVDTAGTMNTPLADFDVLRIRSKMTRTVGLVVSTRRNHYHVAECFGTVSSMTSHFNEAEENFSLAAEVRRITP